VDEHDDGGSGVGPADADVEESASVAEGDLALVVDDVAADALVVVELAAGGGSGLGQGVVDGGRGGTVGQRAVRALLVVEAGEEVEEGLELVECVIRSKTNGEFGVVRTAISAESEHPERPKANGDFG
jgi:hypothetical protein